ncbi:hypothetical protein OKS35_08345 [Exiguobacterium sp. N5]|uniref:hypothetical protein n=1 Tax=Exiguobacterium sp. N5 TaxID=2990450 RepID=UPI0021F4A575|nr:hypothetical protein [Exiguobacterium sp. N5]MCV9900135.1 hypothetical protein [Exiguobacterium sp. N5]
MNKKSTASAIIYYIVFYFMMLAYSYFLLKITHKDNLNEINIIDFSNKTDYVIYLLGFVILQYIFFYVMSFFSRLDGSWFLPHGNALTVSVKAFLQYHKGLFVHITLFMVIGFLSTDFSLPAIPFSWFISAAGILIITGFILLDFNFVYFSTIMFLLVLLKSFNSSDYSVRLDYYVYTLAISLFISVLSFLWRYDITKNFYFIILLLFSFIVSSAFIDFRQDERALIIIIGIIIYVLSSLYFFIKDAIKKEDSKLWDYIKNLLFIEYRIAEQSKRNSENITLINMLFNNDVSKINGLLKEFSRNAHVVFVRPNMKRNSIKESYYLDLKDSRDFRIFVSNSFKKIKGGQHLSELIHLIKVFTNNQRSYSESLMNTRTTNIKLRNQNNLIIGIFIFIVANIIIKLVLTDTLELFIVHFLVWAIFLRMFLRTFEIGKAFYRDLTEQGYNNSFLNGTDRIWLAIKSVIEISILASAIYMLNHLIIYTNVEFKMCTGILSSSFWKNIEYAFSVAIFNVSFPEALIPHSNKNFLWLSTHLIQVVSSLILITISITGYMGREKNLTYFEFDLSKDGTFKIFKMVRESPGKTKLILCHKFSTNTKTDGTLKTNQFDVEILITILNNMFANNEISEKDYDHIMRILEVGNSYFSPKK